MFVKIIDHSKKYAIPLKEVQFKLLFELKSCYNKKYLLHEIKKMSAD